LREKFLEFIWATAKETHFTTLMEETPLFWARAREFGLVFLKTNSDHRKIHEDLALMDAVQMRNNLLQMSDNNQHYPLLAVGNQIKSCPRYKLGFLEASVQQLILLCVGQASLQTANLDICASGFGADPCYVC
jgi:hypothetical protein